MNDKQIENYLKQSTRGLWGRKKAEVREELATHIEGRFNAYLIAGCSEADAVDKTLAELGRPSVVSTGMARLYTLPPTLGLGALFSTLGIIVVLLIQDIQAQNLTANYAWPSPYCFGEIKSNEACISGEPWFSLEQLREILEPQGVIIDKQEDLVHFTFPDSSITATLPMQSSTYQTNEDGTKKAREFQPQEGYFTVWDFINMLSTQLMLPVHLLGWENPTIKIGRVSFRVETDYQDHLKFYAVDSDFIYQNVVNSIIGYGFQNVEDGYTVMYNSSESNNGLRKHITLRNLIPGIYGVIARIHPRDGSEYVFGIDTAPSIDGSITLNLPKSNMVFVDAFDKVIPDTALLIRLTGEMKSGQPSYEIIPPDQITLE